MNPKPIHGTQILRIPVGGDIKNIVVVGNNRSAKLFSAYRVVEERNAKHGTGLKVISKEVARAALPHGALDPIRTWSGGTWSVLPAFPVDAILAHAKPGKELGTHIIFSSADGRRVILPTSSFRGAPPLSALLASGITSSNIEKDGKDILLKEPSLSLLQDFPVESGDYLLHAETGMPYGERVPAGTQGSIYLCMLAGSSYVGPLVFNSATPGMDATFKPSYDVGVVAEVPDWDVAKINEIINRPLSFSERVRGAASAAWGALVR